MLEYGIADNRAFVVLTGGVGTGKTTLLNALVNGLGPDVIIATITNPELRRIDFFNHLSDAFGLGKTYSGKGSFLLDFREFLERCRRNEKQVLLIVDEAQLVRQDMLEEIRLLSNIEHQDAKLLSIFLAGQNEFNEILDRHENRALQQRITLRYHIEPLAEKEIGQFIKHCLKVAGAEREIFTKNAIREICTFTKGYPRLINILCDQAILSGCIADKKVIDVAQIRECAGALKLTESSPTSQPSGFGTSSSDFVAEEKGLPDKRPFAITICAAGAFIITISACLLFFTDMAGSSLPSFFSKWKERLNSRENAVSKQITEIQSVQIQAGFKAENGLEEHEIGKAPVFRAVEMPANKGKKTQQLEYIELCTTKEASPVQTGNEEADGLLAGRPETPATDPSTDRASAQPEFSNLGRDSFFRFFFDSNEISKEDIYKLDVAVEHMRIHPGSKALIMGHTDSVEDLSYNTRLSKIRADIAKDYLVSKGITPDRITSIGMDPIADNDNYWERSSNRNVEVELFYELVR